MGLVVPFTAFQHYTIRKNYVQGTRFFLVHRSSPFENFSVQSVDHFSGRALPEQASFGTQARAVEVMVQLLHLTIDLWLAPGSHEQELSQLYLLLNTGRVVPAPDGTPSPSCGLRRSGCGRRGAPGSCAADPRLCPSVRRQHSECSFLIFRPLPSCQMVGSIPVSDIMATRHGISRMTLPVTCPAPWKTNCVHRNIS